MPINQPYTIGLICARGGSKGVPRKNIRPLEGKPLIGWAIQVARNCAFLDRVIVSTEDDEIADVARGFGAEVPFMRPAELAQDSSPELLSWKHALQTLASIDGKMPEVLVNVPTTSPLRKVEDIEACFTKLAQTQADLCITVRSARHNPYFNMVKLEDHWASIVIAPSTPTFRRQDAPNVFEITTVAYAARAEYVLATPKLLDGRVCATIVPEERSLDIDTELDFAFAEFILNRKKGCHQ
jgi:CMP-N-acetylneuraminic acid synthetase